MSSQNSIEETGGSNTWLGQTIQAVETGSVYAASLIDKVLKQAVDTIVRAEEAFREGLDPNIEDANILQEYENDEE